MATNPVVVALDFEQKAAALDLVSQLDPTLCRLKVGKEMFTHFGPGFVTELQQRKFDVFLDLKFHSGQSGSRCSRFRRVDGERTCQWWQ